MTPTIPEDVLFLVGDVLWHDQDFDTLFNCSLTSKGFATAALPSLYRCVPVLLHTSCHAEDFGLQDA